MFKVLVILGIVALPVFYFLYMSPQSSPPVLPNVPIPDYVARVGGVPIHVEVADTDALREKGLGGRTSLGATSGMLFIFDTSDYYKIWMQDMHILIDIIWINDQFKIVDITRGLEPETYPRTFEPVAPVRFVIEANVNYVESFGIKIGDTVTLPHTLIPADLKKDTVLPPE